MCQRSKMSNRVLHLAMPCFLAVSYRVLLSFLLCHSNLQLHECHLCSPLHSSPNDIVTMQGIHTQGPKQREAECPYSFRSANATPTMLCSR